jgi:hypothetical protein
MWTLGLEARRGVGAQVGAAIESEAVKTAGMGFGHQARKVTARLGLEWEGARTAVAVQDDLYSPPLRRPNTKMYASLRLDLGPDGKSPSWLVAFHGFSSQINEGGTGRFFRFANGMPGRKYNGASACPIPKAGP